MTRSASKLIRSRHSPSGRGGARPNAGRRRGSLGKVSADIRSAAQAHGPKMIEHLVTLAESAEREETRLAACNAVLDRAYGRPTTAIEAKVAVFDPDRLSDAELAAIIEGEGDDDHAIH